MRKLITTIGMALALVLALPTAAFAHVVVTPAEAGVGTRTTFNMSVPNEKEVPVTGLRLTIPAGLESVMPTVHPGWTISTSTDDKKNVTEIRWEGGSIPSGQRDDFTFRVKLPADKTSLTWKAYQTYADGVTVSWDQPPKEEASHSEEESTTGPYSATEVVDDLAADSASGGTQNNRSVTWPFAISLMALILSAIALAKRRG